MGRQNFGIERGLRIFDENSDSAFVDFLSGSGAPPGTSGKTDEASVGSLYMDRSNGNLYTKITDTSSAVDWFLNIADNNIDGGFANSVYLPAQAFDGGGA